MLCYMLHAQLFLHSQLVPHREHGTLVTVATSLWLIHTKDIVYKDIYVQFMFLDNVQ